MTTKLENLENLNNSNASNVTKLRTRRASRGREPRSRDKILHLLHSTQEQWTVKEIAEHFNVSQSTPYKALKALAEENLIIKFDTIDGVAYSINKTKYEETINNSSHRQILENSES